MKNIKNGLILLCLLVLVSACATKPPQVIRVPFKETVIEKVQVPAELLEPCKRADLDTLETTGDLERVALEAITYLEACDQDKTRIREWQEAK